MGDHHQLGMNVQRIQPLGWGGTTPEGLAVQSGCCGKTFLVALDTFSFRGDIYHLDTPAEELFCPYCGTSLPVELSPHRLQRS